MMAVSLNSELEKVLRRLVRTGRYGSEQDVLAAALRHFEARDRELESLRRKVGDGIAQADRGEFIEADEVFSKLTHRHEAKFGPRNWRA